MTARAGLWLLAAALLPSPALTARAEGVHTIELRHRPAAEVLPLVRPLLGPGDGASGTGFLLLLRTDPQRFKEIERVLATVDVAARNLTITVRRDSTRGTAGAEHGMRGRIHVDDRATVRLPVHDRPSTGVRVGDGHVTYGAQARAGTEDSAFVQTLRVQDGQKAYIRVGQSVPHVHRVLALGGRSVVVGRSVVFEDATSGFEVSPRLRGETVHLEITPRLTTSRTPDGVVTFQELRTTVTARLGEWIDLGEILGAASDVHREILTAGRTQSQERHAVLLRVD
ncbi:nolw domain-containing protein [Sulfurifustis variabilis]|uniref:Nolw domain-containing protein n=1 Tax=Sulfurifustis variabilis TaxID=1675686 RepID=A0A1B4V854_9GAMM|nr:hypothetical protein [Sulfurifustis variabilis]BAU48812.1 nolw domain-containing protein [Sulfurifustis variabilis]